MNIEVIRASLGGTCTIGKMYIDGVETCYTLEDVVRPVGEKVYGETAIPYGKYRVAVTWSNHFQCNLPLLLDVPDFVGVRIHKGNTAANTEGCILVGLGEEPDTITRSGDAFDIVWPKIRDAVAGGEEVWIEIKEAS